MAADAPELIGQSRTWLETMERLSLAAQVERSILIIGERGTGKELVAERLHFLSPRWEHPFVKVNCAALSEELLDSELFGHEQGSFTGATKRRIGRFEQANRGTLFLDEVATASQRVQEKLLRVVEYGEFQRLGGEEVHQCDVRVVAATNVDLPTRVRQGRFRADLLDRLAFDVITLAPLRVRPDDIELLAEHFGRRIARELEASFPGFSRAALDVLRAHDWPGNVRELKNTAERMTFRTLAAQANGAPQGPVEIDMRELDPFESPFRPSGELNGAQGSSEGESKPETPGAKPQRPSEADVEMDASAGAPILPTRLTDAVAALETRLIEAALAQSGGHQGEAAELLGLSYHQMRGLLRKYAIGADAGRRRGKARAGEMDKAPVNR
ncbi:phage shock protein operon transcriptional activator [bacterium]|nr:phage shock protein operon transcriptional activator [bacterium]